MSNEQIRAEFIERRWRRYPVIPERAYKENGWVRGRFEKLADDAIHLREHPQTFPVSQLNAGEDKELGIPIPLAALKKGDVVLLQQVDRQVIAVYLLSPCLQELRFAADREWQFFLEAVRLFFRQKGFYHWKTPYLVPSPTVDAHIDFFKTNGVRTGRSYFLPASPEFELKKVIATGEDKVFEIKSAFRDDDDSPHHTPEFTMLEWYRAFEDKWVLLKDIEEMIYFVCKQTGRSYDPHTIKRRSMSELFKEYVGLELTPRTAKKELADALTKQGLDHSSSDDWDDLFFRLYIDRIEPHLGKEGIEAVYNFPATQGSLSRTNAEGWADRFEIYWKGVELANAYQEQNDPFLIEVRTRTEIQKRQKLGRETGGVDEEFLEIMKSGFPPCTGIALGLDRLYKVIQAHTMTD